MEGGPDGSNSSMPLGPLEAYGKTEYPTLLSPLPRPIRRQQQSKKKSGASSAAAGSKKGKHGDPTAVDATRTGHNTELFPTLPIDPLLETTEMPISIITTSIQRLADLALAETHKEKGKIASSKGDWAEAMAMYGDAISLREKYGPGPWASCLSNRSLCYIRLSKFKEAESDARRGLEVDPTWTKSHLRLAQAIEGQLPVLSGGLCPQAKGGAPASEAEEIAPPVTKRGDAAADVFGDSLRVCAKAGDARGSGDRRGEMGEESVVTRFDNDVDVRLLRRGDEGGFSIPSFYSSGHSFASKPAATNPHEDAGRQLQLFAAARPTAAVGHPVVPLTFPTFSTDGLSKAQKERLEGLREALMHYELSGDLSEVVMVRMKAIRSECKMMRPSMTSFLDNTMNVKKVAAHRGNEEEEVDLKERKALLASVKRTLAAHAAAHRRSKSAATTKAGAKTTAKKPSGKPSAIEEKMGDIEDSDADEVSDGENAIVVYDSPIDDSDYDDFFESSEYDSSTSIHDSSHDSEIEYHDYDDYDNDEDEEEGEEEEKEEGEEEEEKEEGEEEEEWEDEEEDKADDE